MATCPLMMASQNIHLRREIIMSKYTVRLDIAGHITEGEALEKRTLKELYYIGKSLCRNARRNQYKLGFSILDTGSGELLVRLYSRPVAERWLVRHSGICKYSGTHKKGYTF